ncbi:RNA methyltransferase [Dichotomicrobium thermohalophilum]|uniref:tRNA (cytidine/uridine-2'-O-)-methyltransferase TrmJ n=1 Tax=Dichotomicrobium thermohalophilum TaxID=933063 RepID=A0A397Q3V9_9HYPH|nr:RNA methyltransferase [Dichotomicrobium thermohalophilum]RIA55099.1 tRNA/rRNA methyltransferase [Dichotomicrobium thermohalophilum]
MPDNNVSHPPAAEGLDGPPTAPAIILVEPQLGDNIGAAARAMANFGLGELRVVAPRDGWPNAAAQSYAANALSIVDNARVFPDLKAAVADLHYVIATTARRRDMTKLVFSPESAAGEMLTRTKARQNCGVLFGKERSGLENDDIAIADAIISAPVVAAFASINLAQAVLLIAYEWRKAWLDAEESGEKTAEPWRQGDAQPATQEELIGFFEQLERELDASGFLRPPEKRPRMVRSIRNMFKRMGATDQEVRTLRGIVASLTRRHEGGSRDNPKMS